MIKKMLFSTWSFHLQKCCLIFMLCWELQTTLPVFDMGISRSLPCFEPVLISVLSDPITSGQVWRLPWCIERHLRAGHQDHTWRMSEPQSDYVLLTVCTRLCHTEGPLTQLTSSAKQEATATDRMDYTLSDLVDCNANNLPMLAADVCECNVTIPRILKVGWG